MLGPESSDVTVSSEVCGIPRLGLLMATQASMNDAIDATHINQWNKAAGMMS